MAFIGGNIFEKIELPEEILLNTVPLRDLVVFPNTVMPLFIGRPFSVEAVRRAWEGNKLLFLPVQYDKEKEEINEKDISKFGTVAKILRVATVEDNRLKVLVQGLSRGEALNYFFDDAITAKVKVLKERIGELSLEDKALLQEIKELLDNAVALGKKVLPDLLYLIKSLEDPVKFTDLVASVLELKTEEALELLQTTDVKQRLKKIYEYLYREVNLLEIQQKIREQARKTMEKEQKEYFLRHQLKAIQEELGVGKNPEVEEYKKKLEALKLPKEIKEQIEKEIERLERLHPDSAEAGVLRTWLDWVLSLPWNKKTRDIYDLERAKKILDEDHYDLEKIKERIIEYLAVRKLTKGKTKGPILLFVGPPGVGKTSLGRSIAKALGRKFARISLGGVRDEAEIRGHRRTYVGAMPGKIMQAIKRAGVKNPVLMLDEIDKMAVSFQGDPAAALLEVLDPEQNKNFVDHYINLPFDLSEVIFICTANRLDTIPLPLLDRMEVLRLSGYSEEEKLEIAKKHLIPKLIPQHGLKREEVLFTDEALLEIIRRYTHEAGVRNLQRQISAVLRKLAVKKLEGEKPPFKITPESVRKFLGTPRYVPSKKEKPMVGVVTGLAWTELGGEIMFIEAIKMKGKGKLTLTGKLGEVMKESAQTALSYIRANAEKYGIDSKVFEEYDVHIHVPEAAIPKDGPSAGIALATALRSLFTDTPVRNDLAMTGEITLTGEVLPVGGIKEKILAAKRAGIYEVILPKENEKEVTEDLPEFVRDKMKFHFVENVEQVFDLALVR
ncbi:MAG: endopeptidase La [Gammaproteobacteria bacterium]|nr:MAG: endopeptidase La [Gammaproteobacteria bacterium]